MTSPPGETRLDRLTETIVISGDQRMIDRLAASHGGRWSPIGLLVVALAGVVHLVTLAFASAGVWALWPGHVWTLKVLGVLLLLVAFALRPTFPRAGKGRGLVDPMKAPATRALVADIAACVGSPMPTRLEVGRTINASAALTGLRGRTILIGAPLWASASRQARIAVLAHELAHFANGDPLRGRYVSGAVQTLHHWQANFVPVSTSRVSMSRAGSVRGVLLTPGMQRFLFWPFRALLALYAYALNGLAAPGHRRAEALADLGSARAAGTAGAIDALEVTLGAFGIEVAANRAAVRREPVAQALEEFRDSFGPDQRAGARRSGAAEQRRLNASHPVTTDRLRLLETGPRLEPAVWPTEDQWAAIEAEWEAPVAGQLNALAEALRYRR